MSKVSFPALKAANRLPSPPAVAMRILQLVAADDTTLDELAHVISADPALTAKILKYLHSPLIGLGFHGTTLAEAVARIGTRGAQLLALSFSLVSQKHIQTCPSFDFNLFWSESLARAVAGRRLAGLRRQWHQEEAFVAGLVFRIGQLVLATALPGEYEAVLKDGAGGPLEERERAALGTDHLEIGLLLLRDWKLPESVWGAVEPFTRRPAVAGSAPAAEPGVSAILLGLADGFAAFLARSEEQHGRGLDTLMAHAREQAGLDRDAFRVQLDQIGQDWITYGEVLAIPTAEPPDLDALEIEAEEHRTALRLAAELEARNLRSENQQLSQLASEDRLTGLHNRGAFDDALAAASGRPGPLALLLIDLDRFKAVNDQHGHPVGDAVLQHVARILQRVVRAPAEAFRFGGEEFAVLAPGLPEDGTVALAAALCQTVADSPHTVGSTMIPLTVSIGVAWSSWPERPLTPPRLVELADQRLYEAKRSGRNTWRR